MTQEEKARAYDEAAEGIQEILSSGQEFIKMSRLKLRLQPFFPELKESEDEKVEKAIFGMVYDSDNELWSSYDVSKSDVLAWLEKQGKQKLYGQREECVDYQFNYAGECKGSCTMKRSEQNHADKVEPFDKFAGLTDFERTLADICIGWIGEEPGWKEYIKDNADVLLKIAIEKFNSVQDASFEQKPVDKIEPMFKVGDWITNDYCAGKVIELTNDAYLLDTGQGIPFSCEHNVHLWTIQDAKDGDVLASKDKEDILIYKSHSEIELLLTSHISFSKKEGFCPRQYSAWDNNEFIPATKEQRDLLFQKMKETGYEWDAEKKELKKIHVIDEGKAEMDYCFTKMMNGEKISSSEEEYNGEDYGIDGLWHAMNILERTLGKVSGYQTDDGFLSHQCAITAVKKLYKQKPTWSEEDKRILNLIIQDYEAASKSFCGHKGKLNWLKSIKQRIGG